MHIKRIHEMEEKLTEIALCEINKGIECVNTAEMGAVIDMIKDLACAEKDAREAKEMQKEDEEDEAEEKYMKMKMKEEHADEYRRYMDEYGDDGERRFYDNYRYKSSGRFAPKGRGSYMPRRGYDEPPYYHMMPEDYKAHDAEWYRDMDRKSKNVMYYSEPVRMDGMKHEESRYDKAKRGYEETKAIHKGNTPEDKQITMREAEKMLNVVFDEIDEMLEDAPQELKNMVKTKGMTRFQKIQ